MSLPAAVSPDPIAVLVLAWDEAAPAVRALVEATQATVPALDSLLVMVPQADAPEGLSAEEYLPIAPPPPALSAAPLAPESEPLPAEVLPLPAASPALPDAVLALLRPGSAATAARPAASVAAAAEPATTDAIPLAWSAVRVVRLGSLSLSQLSARAGQPLPAPSWTGTTAMPAAPYLGATEQQEPASVGSLPRQNSRVASPGLPHSHSEAAFTPRLDATATSARAEQAPLASLSQPTPLSSFTQAAPLYDAAASTAQAPELEADLALAEAEELISLESAENGTLLPDEFSANAEPAPAPTDWEAALVTLRQPAAAPETAAAPPAEPVVEVVSAEYQALRPPPQHYPAPDLNFQIIQYARFAVPVALAEPPFAVLYAPAWPTWLAAQELRQRTGRPLVLHVATLAAADDEPLETATGWIAELQRQALRRADLLIAETPALAQRLCRELGLEASRVLAIPAAEAAAIAQALRGAQVRPVAV
jgi:hypothetical protein